MMEYCLKMKVTCGVEGQSSNFMGGGGEETVTNFAKLNSM